MCDIILVAQFSRSKSFFQGLRFRCRSVLIGTTHVKRSPISRTVISARIRCEHRQEICGTHRLKTSALNVLPMIFPRWGTLLQYGSADVMSTFSSPSFGSLERQISRDRCDISLSIACIHCSLARGWNRTQYTLCRVDNRSHVKI